MKESSVYPGEYIPMPEEVSLLEELIIPCKDEVAKPLINMYELKDSFTIEMMVPGVKRDDIVIHVHDNILSIVALHKDGGDVKKKQLQIHESDRKCLQRSILLPGNADTVFINAEYEAGILRLYIPKTKHPAKNLHTGIIVY